MTVYRRTKAFEKFVSVKSYISVDKQGNNGVKIERPTTVRTAGKVADRTGLRRMGKRSPCTRNTTSILF